MKVGDLVRVKEDELSRYPSDCNEPRVVIKITGKGQLIALYPNRKRFVAADSFEVISEV